MNKLNFDLKPGKRETGEGISPKRELRKAMTKGGDRKLYLPLKPLSPRLVEENEYR